MAESVFKKENLDNECSNEEKDNPSELLQTHGTEGAVKSIKSIERGNKSPESECNKNDSMCTKPDVNQSDNKNDCIEMLDSEELPSSPCQSKKRLQNTKRRAGVLYKQMRSSKRCKVNSKYFSEANKTQKQWIPPRSPYSLLQEDLFDNPWQLLVATIFLTKTAAKRALPQLHKFLAQYSTPEDVLQASYEDIDEYFKPLGLVNTRSHTIMRFTVEFLEKDWKYPRELYGIGKYGDDSYRMFCINEWRQVSPDDIPLTMYRNWLLENAERLGVD